MTQPALLTGPHREAEHAVVVDCIAWPERIPDADLEAEAFALPKWRAAWRVMRRLHAEGAAIDPITVADAMTAEGANVSPSDLTEPHTGSVGAIEHYAKIVADAAFGRQVAFAASAILQAQRKGTAGAELLELMRRQVDRVQALAEVKPTAIEYRRAPAMVDEILARAHEPWVTLALGEEIVRVRAGGIVIIMAPTGGGKSSLVGALMVEHAREHGPAVVASVELPADEFAARLCGMQCDASWPDVLVGRVARVDMERALDLPRLVILDRREATLPALDVALATARSQNPGEPLLAAVDYAQIIASPQDDIRARVSDTMAQIDDIARRHRAVVLAVSQMSRATARATRAGESLGAETTDGGAESAAIERYASVTLTIGTAGEPGPDGSQHVQLSIGKHRMGGGDRVVPMRYEGRTGRWRVDGESRPAAEVRAEARAARDDSRTNAASLAMVAAAEKATEPMTREELRRAAAASRDVAKAAIVRLLEDGELVEVRRRRPRSTAWLIWSPARAKAEGLPVLDVEGSA